METTEIIAELRKRGLSEAADRMESLDKRWKRTRAERDVARDMRARAERLLAEELSRKPTGDLISRSAVLAALSSRLSIVDMIRVAEIVESVPAVELAKRKPRVRAHWINEGQHRRCSACGKRYPRSPQHKPGINLCSACGAHMDEEVSE